MKNRLSIIYNLRLLQILLHFFFLLHLYVYVCVYTYIKHLLW